MKDIEDLENEIEIQRNENSPTIKMPEIKGMRKIRELWERFAPGKFYEHLWMNTSPGTYFLWKLPKSAHKKLNDILDYATSFLARTQPEFAIASGILGGVSHTLYGLKNEEKDSGRHVVSGLTKIAQATEPIDPKFSGKVKKFLEDYFVNFDSEQAVA